MKSKPILDQASQPLTILRLMCGLFYLPHLLFKLHDIHGSLAFFSKAGFNPSWFFLLMALIMEGACFLGLTFNLLVKWAGLISAAVMANAVIGTP
jgi:putative oxidoreductase